MIILKIIHYYSDFLPNKYIVVIQVYLTLKLIQNLQGIYIGGLSYEYLKEEKLIHVNEEQNQMNTHLERRYYQDLWESPAKIKPIGHICDIIQLIL